MNRHFRRYLPILAWLPAYQTQDLKGDLSAGLTVGVMLIPQGMAYAMIAGMPPIYGLYASIFPLILYAIFGTSRQLAVGPVAMVSLLVLSGVSTLAEIGSEAYLLLAITLALLVGLIQLLLGLFRLGFLVNFLSHPVISGFTSAAALIIGMSQLKHLLGVQIDSSNYVHEVLLGALAQLDQVSLPTLAIGLGGIVVIKGLRRVHKSIPGLLIAVILGIVVVYLTGWQDQGVRIVGTVPEGLPSFAWPSFDGHHWKALFPVALTIGLVSFMESIAVAKAIQSKHRGEYEVDANQELIALGMANIGASFFQAFPTTGGFSRTAVNDQAGARTGLAAIISAGLIALTLLFLTPLFYFLPQAILASIIMVAVLGLIDLKEARHLWQHDRQDFWMLFATFAATLTLGIEEGILLGALLSLGLVIYKSAYPHIAVLGQIPGTSYFRNVNRFPEAKVHEDILALRFDAPLYFANAGFFRDQVKKFEQAASVKPKLLLLNAESIHSIDSSAVHMLEQLIEDGRMQGRDFAIAGAIGPVRDALHRHGLIHLIGKDHVFANIQDAVFFFTGMSPHEQSSHLAWQVGKKGGTT